jgi:hypothetical protein
MFKVILDTNGVHELGTRRHFPEWHIMRNERGRLNFLKTKVNVYLRDFSTKALI